MEAVARKVSLPEADPKLDKEVLSTFRKQAELSRGGITVPEVVKELTRRGQKVGLADVVTSVERLLGAQSVIVDMKPDREGWPLWKAAPAVETDSQA